MFAGAQAVDAVIRAVAAVDWFCKGTNLDTIGLSVVGVDLIDTEKLILLRQGFNLERLAGGAHTAAFDLIGVAGGPACR